MVKLRLKRTGRKFEAIYHIVATDARSPRDGRFIEEIGHYNPQTKAIVINEAARDKWLSQGAQPSDTVRNIFKQYLAAKKLDANVTTLVKKPRPAKKKVASSDAAK